MFLKLCFALSLYSTGPLTVLHQEGNSAIISYNHPSAPNSLSISSLIHPSYDQLDSNDFRDTFHLIRKTVSIYQQQELDSWLTIADPNSPHFEYMTIPFAKGYEDVSSFVLSKFYPLLNLKALQPAERNANYLQLLEMEVELKKPPIPTSKDAFSQQRVIDSQLIYEGEKIYLLLNYCPLTSLDSFLVIPKRAVGSFLDLTEEEFIEAELISQKVVQFYPEMTPHFLDKNGKNAWQHEPRWHKHIFFTDGVYDWAYFFFRVISNSPLSKEELEKRMDHFRTTLGVYLNEHS